MICIFRERGKGRVKPAAGEMIYEKAATASVNGYRDRRGRTALNGFRKEMLIIWLQAPRCSASVVSVGIPHPLYACGSSPPVPSRLWSYRVSSGYCGPGC